MGIWLYAAVFFLLTTRLVYQGGKGLNDHIVVGFIFGCVVVYPLYWTLYPFTFKLVDFLFYALFAVGPPSIFSLFWILARRKDAEWRMPLAIFSQYVFSFSLWSWGLGLLYCGPALYFGWPFWCLELVLFTLLLSIWSVLWTYLHQNKVVRVHLSSTGVRIVHLSDLHVSPIMTESDMRTIVEKTNLLRPDLVMITGDLVMPFSEENHAFLLTSLQKLEAPVFCCMGNHDLPIQRALVEGLKSVGVKMLIDERFHIQIRDKWIEIVGLQFQWTNAEEHYQSVMEQLSEVPADLRILLVHDPRYFRVVDAQRFSIMLCGHTHGGQFGLNMFGIPMSFFRPFGFYDQGVFQNSNLKMLVHKGNWHTGLPPRIGIAPEVVHLEC
jgi:uncharacterized protein